LKRDAIFDLFECVEYTGVPGYAKPSPYLLFRAAEALQVNPRKCAYVGNLFDYDVIAAERAGMIPILLTWVDEQEVHKITTDVIIIEHIKDLLEVLR
jgi:FMN phosphatase YigB (HAD superfamily)